MIINLSSLTNKGKFNLKWQGEYCFGETWIAFRGMSAENNLHAHAALQALLLPMTTHLKNKVMGG